MIQVARDPALEERKQEFERGKFGLTLFFVSLSMLFGGVLLGFVILRLDNPHWRGAGMLDLPWELWVSTAVLGLGSYFLWRAQVGAVENRPSEVFPQVRAATACLLAFLVLQSYAWGVWWVNGVTILTPSLYSFSFYVLTALHALHVLGGYVPLYKVLRESKREHYHAQDHGGLTLCAMYWHYLGVVWLVLFATLLALAWA